jgi:hypothetical protein
VRIVSDGTPPGTKVYVQTDPRLMPVELTRVTKVEWTLDAGAERRAEAVITLQEAIVDVVGDGASMATAKVGPAPDKPRSGDEPWAEKPWGIVVGELADADVNRPDSDGHAIRVYGSWEGQPGLIAEIEREANERKAARVLVSKCFYRLLLTTLGDVKYLREQHYCYAAFG